MKYFLMASLATLSLHACFYSSQKEANDVYIRIDNQTGYTFSRATIGRSMNKKSSYRNTSFSHTFKDLSDGQITDYTNTYGKHYGYHGLSCKVADSHLQFSKSSLYFEKQLHKHNAYMDTINHVYSGNPQEGLNLPKGKYTFTLKMHENEKKTLINVDITKDE